MYLQGTSGRLVNPGAPQPMMPKPGMMNDGGMAPQPMLPKPGMMNDGGMRPSLGGLVQMHPGHERMDMVPGGGLARLMAMYGRPGRALGNPYGTPAY